VAVDRQEPTSAASEQTTPNQPYQAFTP